MSILYLNHQDDFDPMNSAVFSDGGKLGELLEARKKQPPFLAKLSGDNGFELMIGIGRTVGCAQYSRSDGNPPYLMAMSPRPPMNNGGFEFLTADTLTPIPARHILRFVELKEIALHFLVTGERSTEFGWENVGAVKPSSDGRWRPDRKLTMLRLLQSRAGRHLACAGASFSSADSSAEAPEVRKSRSVRYHNLHDDLDPMNGVVIGQRHQLIDSLERLRRCTPIICQLTADCGFHLIVGVGLGIGCAQYKHVSGDLPYFMALPTRRHVKSGVVEFLKRHAVAPIPARYILDFDELTQIALHFLETGERAEAVSWEPI